MLPDPLSITYNGSAKSLPRAAFEQTGVSRLVNSQSYVTSNGEFAVTTAAYAVGKNDVRVEILLHRILPDSDTNPFNGINGEGFGNSFGFVLVMNKYRYETATDLPLLRTALSSFVDSTLLSRLIGGEL